MPGDDYLNQLKKEIESSSKSKPVKQKPQPEAVVQDEFDKLNLLSCEHYEYEYNSCKNLKSKIYDYYRGDTPAHPCEYYQNLLVDCLKYKRDPRTNFESLVRLKKYENELVEKRNESIKQNDVWTLRERPPSDWNAPLPDWCMENLKQTYWYKSKMEKESNKHA